jgi:flavin reductase
MDSTDGAARRGGATSPSAGTFTAAMRAAATGVTIVSTDGRGGRVAQTVSAMCRVSASPPLVLACLRSRSLASEAVGANGVFCVSVLGVQHDLVADVFAGRPSAGGRPWDFGCCGWEPAPSGSPRIADAVAAFDCAVQEVVVAGTHCIYIGQVRDVIAGTGIPLVYSAHGYARPEPVGMTAAPRCRRAVRPERNSR